MCNVNVLHNLHNIKYILYETELQIGKDIDNHCDEPENSGRGKCLKPLKFVEYVSSNLKNRMKTFR